MLTGYVPLFLTPVPQKSKFKPPKSLASARRDQLPPSTPAVPSKRLSSDPETPPPSSTIQSKRPRCHTGNEKENHFSQETPLAGVTNLVHRATSTSPQKDRESIDVDRDFPSPGNSSDATGEFVKVSQVNKRPLPHIEQPSGNRAAAPKSCRRPGSYSGPTRSAHPEGPRATGGIPTYHVRPNLLHPLYLP